MEYFMGVSFDNKEQCKTYKKLDAAEKAAEKLKAAVFDENGEVVKDFREAEKEAEQPQTPAAEEAVTETLEGVPVKIKGKIKRVFNGSIRIRKAPSWSNDAVMGASTFTEKVVTHVMEVDGKPMYKTLDGYFVSGDPKLVEFIEE